MVSSAVEGAVTAGTGSISASGSVSVAEAAAEGGHRPSRPGRSQRPRVRSMRTRADRRCQRASYHCELAPYRCELAPYRCEFAPYRCDLAPCRCGFDADRPGRLGRLGRSVTLVGARHPKRPSSCGPGANESVRVVQSVWCGGVVPLVASGQWADSRPIRAGMRGSVAARAASCRLVSMC